MLFIMAFLGFVRNIGFPNEKYDTVPIAAHTRFHEKFEATPANSSLIECTTADTENE